MSEPAKYRTKPTTVEAVQVTAENWEEVRDWSGGHSQPDGVLRKVGLKREHQTFDVRARSGWKGVAYGDYVIKLADRVFESCPADAFERTHERA